MIEFSLYPLDVMQYQKYFLINVLVKCDISKIWNYLEMENVYVVYKYRKTYWEKIHQVVIPRWCDYGCFCFSSCVF